METFVSIIESIDTLKIRMCGPEQRAVWDVYISSGLLVPPTFILSIS